MFSPKSAPWIETSDCAAKWRAARDKAQAAANADGMDRGLERNDVFKEFRVFILPRRENRTGHELRCEVVSCEILAKCQPGHGPRA
jgi:hypothetical protein